MRITVLILVLIIGVNVKGSNEIEDEVVTYFESAIVKEFEQLWLKQKKSIESAIRLILWQSYGKPRMNIFQKKAPLSRKIASGFYLSDNIVEILLLNLTLRDLPNLKMPEVIFSLDKNLLRLEAGLSKMFIEADYLLFRNYSALLYAGGEVQDPYKNSPFSFQQVQTVGQLAIIAEDCHLIGSSIATLTGHSVNLGYSTLRITDCKFSVEIYTQGSGTPPVIAPYFSKDQNMQLSRLLAKPIVDEITMKLQGVLYSYVNTTSIFGKELMKFRHHQAKIFKKTSDFMVKAIRNLNKITVENNQGRIPLKDFEVYWDEKPEIGDETRIALMDMSLNGLDTAYSTNKGGPYCWGAMKIGESVRFNTMHLQGKIRFDKGPIKGVHDFAAELHDVTVAVTVSINMVEDNQKEQTASKTVNRYEVVDWRAMEYSIMHINMFIKERIASHALVSGYLINEVPKWVAGYMSEAFPKAAFKASSIDDEELGGLDEYGRRPDAVVEEKEEYNENHNNDDGVQKLNVIDSENGTDALPPYKNHRIKLKMKFKTKNESMNDKP